MCFAILLSTPVQSSTTLTALFTFLIAVPTLLPSGFPLALWSLSGLLSLWAPSPFGYLFSCLFLPMVLSGFASFYPDLSGLFLLLSGSKQISTQPQYMVPIY